MWNSVLINTNGQNCYWSCHLYLITFSVNTVTDRVIYISNNILSQNCYWSCHLYLITFSVNTAFARLHGNYILSCRTFYYQNISMTLQVLQIRQKLLSTDQSGESAFWIGRVVPNDLPISDIKIGILSPWTIMQRGSEWVSEWVGDCCLTPIQQFFSYIMARTS